MRAKETAKVRGVEQSTHSREEEKNSNKPNDTKYNYENAKNFNYYFWFGS